MCPPTQHLFDNLGPIPPFRHPTSPPPLAIIIILTPLRRTSSQFGRGSARPEEDEDRSRGGVGLDNLPGGGRGGRGRGRGGVAGGEGPEMKSFKEKLAGLRDFARQGGRNREKQQVSDGNGSSGGYQAGGGGGYGWLEPTTLDAELIAKGMKDLRGAQKKYEMLVSLSAEVSNRAHDLSTAIHEMASYFAAPGVLGDECHETGRVFKHVGRVQFEISKSLELYASHVTQTVSTPTEDLIFELQNVLETKKDYDMKRQSLDFYRARTARKKPKAVKDEEQVEALREQFEEVGRFLGDQLISLQQGRSQRLITQAARHHAAQMKLFTKALVSLHEFEPHIKQVTQELNIDRRLRSVDMDEFDVEDAEVVSNTEVINDDESYVDDGDEEMEHHYSRNHSRESYLESGSSDNGGNIPLNNSREWSSYRASTSDNIGISKNEGYDSPLPQWVTKGSKSTPTSPLGTYDRIAEVDKSHHHSAIPTHSPIVHRRATKMGVPMTMFQPFDHSLTIRPMPLPRPVDTPPSLNFEAPSLSSTPRGFVTLSTVPSKKRYSHSGPLTPSAKPRRSHASIVPNSGPLLRSTTKTIQPPGSPYREALSPSTPASSPSQISPSQICELHKLPPPPLSSSSSPISSGMVPHSAPLHRREAKHLPSKTWT